MKMTVVVMLLSLAAMFCGGCDEDVAELTTGTGQFVAQQQLVMDSGSVVKVERNGNGKIFISLPPATVVQPPSPPPAPPPPPPPPAPPAPPAEKPAPKAPERIFVPVPVPSGNPWGGGIVDLRVINPDGGTRGYWPQPYRQQQPYAWPRALPQAPAPAAKTPTPAPAAPKCSPKKEHRHHFEPKPQCPPKPCPPKPTCPPGSPGGGGGHRGGHQGRSA